MTNIFNDLSIQYDLLTILAIAGVIGLVVFSGAQAIHAFSSTADLPAAGSSLMFTRALSPGFDYTFFP